MLFITHILFRALEDNNKYYLLVPDLLISLAGNSFFFATLLSSTISEFPVPLNSSKITSSILDPVSIEALAIMVSDPPFSILRAAPKNRFGI